MSRNEKLLLKNVRIADIDGMTEEPMDVFISGGTVAAVTRHDPGLICEDTGVKEITCTNLFAIPSLVDVHVHFRDPGFVHKEDILSGSLSAAAGGYTAVCCMPNTKPAIDSAATVLYIDRNAKDADIIDVFQTAAMTEGQIGKTIVPLEELNSLDTRAKDLTGHGVVGITEDGQSLMDDVLMEEIATRAAALDLPVMDHAEDSALRGGCMNLGEVSERLGVQGLPQEAELNIIERDVALARKTGARFHIQHVSNRRAVELIRRAKASLPNFTAETAPHYIAFTEKDVERIGTNAKMNPPLRTEDDRLAIIEGLKDGSLDMIATDHAPHTADEKALPLEEAPFGIVGLETAFPLSYTELVKGGHISLVKLLDLMCGAPARLIGLEHGRLQVGSRADIAIVDLENEYVIDSSTFKSKGRNTPADGRKVFGKIKYTLHEGRLVYEDV
jgi:dihydroorotase